MVPDDLWININHDCDEKHKTIYLLDAVNANVKYIYFFLSLCTTLKMWGSKRLTRLKYIYVAVHIVSNIDMRSICGKFCINKVLYHIRTTCKLVRRSQCAVRLYPFIDFGQSHSNTFDPE